MKDLRITLFVLLILLVLLAWAPWMNDQILYEQIIKEKAFIDGTIDKETGELICDYKVIWAPFGRYIASCEGGYFVTFYGQLI